MREVLTEYVKSNRVSAVPCAPVHIQDGPKRSDEWEIHFEYQLGAGGIAPNIGGRLAYIELFSPNDFVVPPRSQILKNMKLRFAIPAGLEFDFVAGSDLCCLGFAARQFFCDTEYDSELRLPIVNSTEEVNRYSKGDVIAVLLPHLLGNYTL